MSGCPTPGWPLDRSWVSGMSERLLWCAGELRVDNKEVQWEELISSDTLLTEVGASLRRHGWPNRYPQECRQELLRLRASWEKRVEGGKFRNESGRRWFAKNPTLWMYESEDDDDVFMPIGALSSKGKTAASSKGKGAASSKGKGAVSSKGNGAESSKDK